MEVFTNLVLSSGDKVEFNNDFVGWLTESCLRHDILHCSFTKKAMCQEQLLLSDIRNKLNINVTKNDMEAIMQWLRRVLYDKARSNTSENDWLKKAPEWLLNAAVRLRLLPAEQLPQPAEDMVLSACATRALLRRVHDTRGKLVDPLLELIWGDVRQFAMLKLLLLLRQGDRPNDGCNLTDMEWRVVDLVLLHHSSDEYLLIIEDSLEAPASRLALDVLCELVREHRLNKCTGRGELARRWGRAYEQYTSKGLHTSLVALQRRWFELRRRASEVRESLACALLERVHQLAVDATAASYSWTDLVSGGMIFTHQDVIESEIMSTTSEWRLNCGPFASVTDDSESTASREIVERNVMLNHDSNIAFVVEQKTNELTGMEVEEAQSMMAETNNCRLPRKEGRPSSYLVFESDDDDLCSEDNFNSNPDSPSQEDPEEDIISLADAILKIESEAVIAKRPKLLANRSISTSNSKITLFNASHSLEVAASLSHITLKTEPEESSFAHYLKLEHGYSGSIGIDPKFELSRGASPTPDVAPPLAHVTFEEEIDPKLLMNTKVIVEKLDIQKYINRKHSASKRSRPSKRTYVEDEESGSEWSPGGEGEEGGGWSSEEACDGRSDEALRPVTLRDIEEVRRRAQSKLTAQVAPVTLAATDTHDTPDTPNTPNTPTQESGSQDDPSAPRGDSNTDTTAPAVVVEVTKYCPKGLQATRLRFGQGMYRRELDAAATARRKLLRAKRGVAKARKKAKKRRKKTKKNCEDHQLQENSPKSLAKEPSEKDAENLLGDDMREWIRQRNLNSRYFGPAPRPRPLALPCSQRRSSNPTVGVDKSTLRHKERAASLGKDSAPMPAILAVKSTVPVLQTQHPVITNAITPANAQLAAGTSSPQPPCILRIVPIATKEPATPGSSDQPVDEQPKPQTSLESPTSTPSTPPMAQLIFSYSASTDKKTIPSNCAALWPVMPVKIIPVPPNPGKSTVTEAAVENVAGDSSAAQSQSLDDDQSSEKDKSKVVEVPAELEKRSLLAIDITNEPPPLRALEPGPKPTNGLVPVNAIFGNLHTVTAQDYVKGEDGSRLKIICKETTKPFWIVAGEYLVLTEEADETTKHGVSYYTLAPPAEIKRIVFESKQSESGAAQSGSAPRRLSVQKKVYRKLCSTPLRYAQVLWAVRSVTHARRITSRGCTLLAYSARRRHLAPLCDVHNVLDIYNKDPSEEIIIDD